MAEIRTGMTDHIAAKEAMLASIRSSLKTSAAFDADWLEHHGQADNAVAERIPVLQSLSREALAENFKTNLESVGGHCAVVSSENAAAEYVRAVVKSIGATSIAISNSDLVKRVIEDDAEIEFVENAPVDHLFECDLGITSAQWAIAETGTLVLESDRESHRLTSLVPPEHLCVLKAGNIRQTLSEILEATSRELSRTMTFITGPSRTSDIELTPAIGVHGPGELHVVIIAD